jgi:hypothetical protein
MILAAVSLSIILLASFGIVRGRDPRFSHHGDVPSDLHDGKVTHSAPVHDASEVPYYGRSPPVYPCRQFSAF